MQEKEKDQQQFCRNDNHGGQCCSKEDVSSETQCQSTQLFSYIYNPLESINYKIRMQTYADYEKYLEVKNEDEELGGEDIDDVAVSAAEEAESELEEYEDNVFEEEKEIQESVVIGNNPLADNLEENLQNDFKVDTVGTDKFLCSYTLGLKLSYFA